MLNFVPSFTFARTWSRGAGLALLAAAALATQAPVQAQTVPVRLAILSAVDLVPVYVAIDKGYFQKAGVNVTMNSYNTGPAAASAVAGGSADIGFAATVPIIIARQNGQPFQMFAGLTWEIPPTYVTFLVAGPKSGITSVEQLTGKTVAPNAAASGCDLITRYQLMKAHVPYANVKIVTMPFPLMEAALVQGNIDVACLIDPFYTRVIQDVPGARVIGQGQILDEQAGHKYPTTVLFARGDWLQSHVSEAKAIKAALTEAYAAIEHDPSLATRALENDMHVPAKVAEKIVIGRSPGTTILPADLEPQIRTMVATKMIPNALPAGDVVFAFPK